MPCAWQGWVVMAVWIVGTIGGSLAIVVWAGRSTENQSDFLAHFYPLFFVFVIAMCVLIMAICWAKGEPPRWRWGDDDDEAEEER